MSRKQYIESIIKIIEKEDVAGALGFSTNKEIGRAMGTGMYEISKTLGTLANVDQVGIILVEKVLVMSISLFAEKSPTQKLRKLFIHNIINSLQKELIND